MIKIREPYYSAGKRYGWPYSLTGIGVAKKYFDGEGDIELTIGDDPTVYRIQKSEAREVVNKWKSYYLAGETMLGVIPKELFQEVKTMQEELETMQNIPKLGILKLTL
jgi:uncharacterized protein YgfB (UPF0149 family)